MTKIGKDIHVETSDFKGKTYIAIRRFYEKDGEWLPGRQGINMKAEEWLEFCEKFEEIKEEINSRILISDDE